MSVFHTASDTNLRSKVQYCTHADARSAATARQVETAHVNATTHADARSAATARQVETAHVNATWYDLEKRKRLLPICYTKNFALASMNMLCSC